MDRNVISVRAEMDRQEVLDLVRERGFAAVPVVDKEGHLLGVIAHDDLISVAEAEASEDMQKMFGAGGDERAFSPILFSVRKRLPWLVVNVATAFLAASVVGLFQDIIHRLTFLAVLMPIIAGQAGNTGAQSLAVVIRALAVREINISHALGVIVRSLFIGSLTGVAIALLAAGAVFLWTSHLGFSAIVGLAMLVTMAIGCMAGAAIPLGLRALKLDPAQSSSVFATTVTDCLGFFSLLWFATLFEKLLLAG
jgi:magnesium transporter